MDALQGNPIISFSLLPVWVLVGLFQYLNRFTGKRHFKTWTASWLFYALFLTVTAAPPGTIDPALLGILKNWCVATAALLMLWGTFQFINAPATQRLIAMMILFNLMWSCATAQKLGQTYFSAFAFLALASGFTAFSFFSRRTQHVRRGAALLTLAFGLWALFLLCSPFLRGSEALLLKGFMASSGLQLFIAIGMMVLVLEDTRGKLQTAVDNFSREVHQSSRFRTEAEIATESYRALFENSKDAVAIVAEDDLEILDLNVAARKLFGLNSRSGLSLRSLCSVPNQKQTDTKALLAALPGNPEVELTLHDGARVHARIRCQATRHGTRKAQQIIFTEVAERARLGRQIRSGGKMSALGQVISGLAHELNNPLAAIKGYTDLVLLTSDLDPQTRSALLKVSLESNRAAKLVHDLLAFARPETPRIEPVNLNELIQKVALQRQEELRAKEISLELDLSSHPALALASSEQMQQVLAHLLNNAAEALEDSDGQRTIRLSTSMAGSTIQLRVEDDGPGIDPDILPRIFEPFFTTKPLGTGTGIGLSVCYSIVLQHKGRITCQPGKLGGACFTVELPAAFSALEPLPKIVRPEFTPPKPVLAPRLLVVDDEPSVAALLADMLSLAGCQVTTETSPFAALARIENELFDAVLTDFRMPGMNGRELYQRATRLQPGYGRRFLFVTGDMMDPETHEFFEQTHLPHLLKPFKLEALQTALASLLEQGGHRTAVRVA